MNRRTAAGTNVKGFVADPRALIFRCGIPTLPRAGVNVVARELVELPQIGLVAEARVWRDLPTRSVCGAYALYSAAAVGDPNALRLLTSV